MSRVLCVGDLHCPAVHFNYISFCKEVYKRYRCNKVVFIGDIIDHEAISMHDKNPELPGAAEEYAQTMLDVKTWYKAFPEAKVCIGNHDCRVARIGSKAGIPSMYFKPYNALYGTPKWDWDWQWEIDGVLYSHGDGWGSSNPAFNAASKKMQSVVCGHYHSIAGITLSKASTPTSMLFGMNVGSGVDQSHPAMLYSKPHLKKAILSCGVIIDGRQPYLEIM